MNPEAKRPTASSELQSRIENLVDVAYNVREKAKLRLTDISQCPPPENVKDTVGTAKSMPPYFRQIDDMIDVIYVHLSVIEDQLDRVEF